MPFNASLEQANFELLRLLQLSPEAALAEVGEDDQQLLELVSSLEAHSRQLRLQVWPGQMTVGRNLPVTDVYISEPRPRDKRERT